MISAESPLFLLVAGDHTAVTLAVCEGTRILWSDTESARRTGSMLIPRIDSVLRAAGRSLKECAFIAASCGPAPFTTLRVVVATVNGLGYATGLPLVQVDRFSAGLFETTRPTIMLYNAFGGDLYYAVRHGEALLVSGCDTAVRVEEYLEPYTSRALYIGDGVPLLYPSLHTERAGPTIAEYAQCALSAWCAGKSHQELAPLYLKAAWVTERSALRQSLP
jgi:tRNA threonylcarbamoyl adenosine modification protein YeaZ